MCVKYEHSSCNHLYHHLPNHLTRCLFRPAYRADTWMVSPVYIGKCASYSSSLSAFVAGLVVPIVTLKGKKLGFFCCSVRGKVL